MGNRSDPFIGRQSDLWWVGETTYRGSHRRPTVGFKSNIR